MGYRIHDIFQSGEVAIVGGHSSRKLPDSLDGVEFRTVGREKVEFEMLTMSVDPVFQHDGMMVSRIVGYNDHLSSFAPVPYQLLQKESEGIGVEYR